MNVLTLDTLTKLGTDAFRQKLAVCTLVMRAIKRGHTVKTKKISVGRYQLATGWKGFAVIEPQLDHLQNTPAQAALCFVELVGVEKALQAFNQLVEELKNDNPTV